MGLFIILLLAGIVSIVAGVVLERKDPYGWWSVLGGMGMGLVMSAFLFVALPSSINQLTTPRYIAEYAQQTHYWESLEDSSQLTENERLNAIKDINDWGQRIRVSRAYMDDWLLSWYVSKDYAAMVPYDPGRLPPAMPYHALDINQTQH